MVKTILKMVFFIVRPPLQLNGFLSNSFMAKRIDGFREGVWENWRKSGMHRERCNCLEQLTCPRCCGNIVATETGYSLWVFMKDWKQKKGIRNSGGSADVVITKYTVTVDTAKAIKKSVPTYGSQGRALQVATEMMIRMEDPPALEGKDEDAPVVRVSVRLHRRTYELIRRLSERYGENPGQVIAACMKVLRMKKIRL
jgi:hypothetical protein